MTQTGFSPIDALIVALPETSGSTLYGMVDVLSATGNLGEIMAGRSGQRQLIRPRIISTDIAPFQCGNNIPVAPDAPRT
jgi:hypothetical protein